MVPIVIPRHDEKMTKSKALAGQLSAPPLRLPVSRLTRAAGGHCSEPGHAAAARSTRQSTAAGEVKLATAELRYAAAALAAGAGQHRTEQTQAQGHR